MNAHRAMLVGAAAVAVATAAAGCTGGIGTSKQTGSGASTGTPGSGGSSNPGSGGSGSGNAGGSTGSAGNPNLVLSCPTEQLGSPLLRQLNRVELQNTLTSVFPDVAGQWTASLPSDTISAHGFDNDASAVIGTQLAGAIVDLGAAVGTAVTGDKLAAVLPCAPGATSTSAQHTCAQTFIQTYGQRLFRRPVTNDEQTRYLKFFDTSLGKSDFKSALKWLTAALIQSPNTLYRSEIGTDKGDGTRQLSPYEIATELAYTYTGTTPSDDLLKAAASGSLGDLATQAQTLLATDQGKQALHRFFEQYLEYSNAPSLQKPNVPMFSSVSADMVKETHAFIDDVVFTKRGGLKDLLTAPTTNPSSMLATYYGQGNAAGVQFPAPSTDYAAVMRPAGTGIGVLAQGAFLSTHAAADHDSPTKRGLFVYYKLFCQPKLMPPPNVPPLDTTTTMATVNTTRDRYEKVHQLTQGATGICHTCHSVFDPIGFAFEHFDEGGRYRTKEGNYPVDSTGSVAGPNGSTLTFTGEDDLIGQVVAQPVIHQCLAAYLATYAYGTDDACIGAGAVPDLQAGKIGIADAFARMASEPHFTRRASP